MNSKEVCSKLKEIRQQVADANGIPYEPTPCNFEGECQGTCPKCEEELKYISDALEQKQEAGEEVNLTSCVEVTDGNEEATGIKYSIIETEDGTYEIHEERLGGDLCFVETTTGVIDTNVDEPFSQTNSDEIVSLDDAFFSTENDFIDYCSSPDFENIDSNEYLNSDEPTSKNKS